LPADVGTLGGGLGQHLRRVVDAGDVRVGPARAEKAGDVAGAGAEIVDVCRGGEIDAIEEIERGSQPVPGELEGLRRVPGHRPRSDQTCFSIVSASLTSNLPGPSTLIDFTTPLSTSIE